MLSIAVLALAAAVFFGVDLAKIESWMRKASAAADKKAILAGVLALAAVLLLPSWHSEDIPGPPPEPAPFSLRGAFVGENASNDAATVGALLCELADEVEWDGEEASKKGTEPFYKTGAQVDQLRKVARILRCRGESIGDRQPEARDKIASYLEEHVGTDAGPLTDASRLAWVSGLREAGKAATDAAQ